MAYVIFFMEFCGATLNLGEFLLDLVEVRENSERLIVGALETLVRGGLI